MSEQEEEKRQGRNEQCACGSGKKYKKCCGQSDMRAEHFGSEQPPSNERYFVLGINKEGEAVAFTPAEETEAEAQRRGITQYAAIAALASFRDATGYRFPTSCLFMSEDRGARQLAETAFRNILHDVDETMAAVQQGHYQPSGWTRPFIASAQLVQNVDIAGDEWRKNAHLVMEAIRTVLIRGHEHAANVQNSPQSKVAGDMDKRVLLVDVGNDVVARIIGTPEDIESAYQMAVADGLTCRVISSGEQEQLGPFPGSSEEN